MEAENNGDEDGKTLQELMNYAVYGKSNGKIKKQN